MFKKKSIEFDHNSTILKLEHFIDVLHLFIYLLIIQCVKDAKQILKFIMRQHVLHFIWTLHSPDFKLYLFISRRDNFFSTSVLTFKHKTIWTLTNFYLCMHFCSFTSHISSLTELVHTLEISNKFRNWLTKRHFTSEQCTLSSLHPSRV